ncbi:MAG TPA: sodium:proton antiporter, partial [Chitinophagaceae bacterium]|nr:sodium:proton antiporter [Chitinophagaceae bacterium]
MSMFLIITILVVLTACFAFLNIRYLKLPETIGMMIISLIFSMLLITAGLLFPEVSMYARRFVGSIDFTTVLLDVMLSFLLFA